MLTGLVESLTVGLKVLGTLGENVASVSLSLFGFPARSTSPIFFCFVI